MKPFGLNLRLTGFLAFSTLAASSANVTGPSTARVCNAEVRVPGSGRIVHPDNAGAFRIAEVFTGPAVTAVRYAGYERSDGLIDVAVGGAAQREINIVSAGQGTRMADGAIKLQEVVVSIDREGSAKAHMED